ncbi:LLM class flavin-dependent oxidoreductase [Cohnella faecalis]|nr:LLM class flavin-dependent oxidoreductase [Cohnella faecalis]
MEFCWTLPVDPNSFAASIEQACAAESHRYGAVLVSSLPKGMDPWVLSTAIGQRTKEIRLLIAQNTNYTLPTVTAKAWNSLKTITGCRADLNIVTGSYLPELAKHGKPLNHSDRYKKTYEFVEILQLLKKGKTSFNGDFFQINHADVTPPFEAEDSGNIFVAGSSQDAETVAAFVGDRYVVYADDVNTIRNKFAKVKAMGDSCSRQVKCGIFIDIIARRTASEAWACAEKMVADSTYIQRRLNKAYVHQADSIGVRNHGKYFIQDDYKVDQHLWAGLSQISDSVSLSIVGSYLDVITALKRYEEAGTDYFIVSGSRNDREIERIGQYVLPYANG